MCSPTPATSGGQCRRYEHFSTIVTHHHWAAAVSRGWRKASECRLQVSLSCVVLCHIVSLQYLSRSSPLLGWSPLSSFLVIWSPSGDTQGPSVAFEAVNMPCPEQFHFSHSDYIYDFRPLPDPNVGLSVLVCDVEHTSFHFGLCGRKFVLCLFGQCPGLCSMCHSWQHAGVYDSPHQNESLLEKSAVAVNQHIFTFAVLQEIQGTFRHPIL